MTVVSMVTDKPALQKCSFFNTSLTARQARQNEWVSSFYKELSRLKGDCQQSDSNGNDLLTQKDSFCSVNLLWFPSRTRNGISFSSDPLRFYFGAYLHHTKRLASFITGLVVNDEVWCCWENSDSLSIEKHSIHFYIWTNIPRHKKGKLLKHPF